MAEIQKDCPQCSSPYCYQDSELWICPGCFHEWSEKDEVNAEITFVDSVGNILKDGDSITVIKDLKVGKNTIKSGTKAKNIKLLSEPVNGHEISCKVVGHGHLYLTGKVVKKA